LNGAGYAVVYTSSKGYSSEARCMMNKIILAMTSLAFLMHLGPALAKPGEYALANDKHPISSLIGDWPKLRAGILDQTKQYDKYSDIKDSQISALPRILIGRWQTQTHTTKAGNQLHNTLDLEANHEFSYHFVALTGTTRQAWDFSGTWEVKNRILMLLIQHSSYPGEQKHDILFWRLLHADHAKLVYVRTDSRELVAMIREEKKTGS
jgi:hypothetical protein